jgi:methanethiol oxidase
LTWARNARWFSNSAPRTIRRKLGFAGVVLSLKDLSSSIWLWFRDGENWSAKKVVEIPAEPAAAELLPPILKGFSAVAPLLTDINLSVDDQRLYASCWGTGESRQYDVSDPHHPKLIGSIHLGGIVRKTSHPVRPGKALSGGPQMVELSRDGKRVYITNSLYGPWDKQFYPEGLDSWMVKVDTKADSMALDPKFFLEFGDLRGHQVRLEGGDASSDSYCYP